MDRPVIGIIGGSGLYEMEGVTGLQRVPVETPFGPTSDDIAVGQLDGHPVAFLSRHGRGHRLAPHEIPYRANIWALKHLGVRWLISVSAVGSMREDIAPGELVMVDQFIDRTRARPSTFFEGGVVAHVAFADPVCGALRGALCDAATQSDVPFHDGGCYVCIDGPQFSTRAESMLFRSWGVSVIGMTNLPEARLAREAQLAYATIALATDYDCWHTSEEEVSVAAVVAIMRKNVANAQRVIRRALPAIADLAPSPAFSALQHATMTADEVIPAEARLRLGLLLDDREYHTPEVAQ
ncbi:MAG: S-methyl-5'-thioadenosine phosphorylase [Deltaproteobacteria bacterium]|nr:S-methyl-5'-thioadenosine phosphorylase [Deltaproteobacteria bacterium]